MAKAPGTTFDQLPLTEMKHGLAKPIATIRFLPSEISKKLGISFEETEDDLDALQAAAIRTASGRQFGLVRHRHQPTEGVDILTDERSTDLTRDLHDAMGFLRIHQEDLSWIHPEVELDSTRAEAQSWFKKIVAQKAPAGSENERPRASTAGYKTFVTQHSSKDVLSSDVEISGTIKFQKELLIDGRFEGEIISDGVLTVGENANIRADIKTRSIIIYGKVYGDVIGSERCELKSKCRLEGNLKAARLIIEEGAAFIGKSEVSSGMSVKASSVRPEVVRHEMPEKSLARA
jgi:cytoskeletal protein CcmA (bactofilin family)